jgi:Protein of unknown function (DUF2924)
MKRSPSRSGTRGLADELAELRGLDLTALKQRWRVLYRTEAPLHIGRALLLQAVAYRLQERVLGGLRSSTAACSSGPQKITSTGDRQPRRRQLGSRRAPC